MQRTQGHRQLQRETPFFAACQTCHTKAHSLGNAGSLKFKGNRETLLTVKKKMSKEHRTCLESE